MPTPKLLVQKKASPKKVESSSGKLPLMKQEPMGVYGRIRRLQNIDDILVVKKIDEQHLEVISLPPLLSYRFKFQTVFDHSCSQNEVFDLVAAPLVHDLIHAKNGLILTYGSCGSGKTHTIAGHPEEPGIVPRAIDMIFNTLQRNDLQSVPYIFKVNSRNNFEIVPAPDAVQQVQNNLKYCQTLSEFQVKSSGSKTKGVSEWKNRIKENSFVKDVNCDYSYGVFVSFIRIYSDGIVDLLDDDQAHTNGTDGPRKIIMEDAKRQSYVRGAKQVEVRGAEDAIELLAKGMKHRKTGINSKNEESIRSHSIFTIRIVRSPLDLEGVLPIDNKKFIQIGQLSIVDLAGCERAASTETSNGRLGEGKNIDHSLSTLEKCLSLLRENQKSDQKKKLIPYRDSNLTYLFKSFFEGDGRVRMVVCLDPRFKYYHTTVHVCKFAEKSQELTTNRTSRANFLGGMLAMHTKCESSVFYAPVIEPIQCSTEILNDWEDDDNLPKLMEYVDQKREEFETLDSANQTRQIEIRDAILEMEQELASMKDELISLKKEDESKRIQLCDYENKFNDMQQQIATIETSKRKLLKEINDLKQQLKIEKQSRLQSENQSKSLRAKLGKVLENEAIGLQKKLVDALDSSIVSKRNNLDRKKHLAILQNFLSADDSPCPDNIRKFLFSSDSIAAAYEKHVSFSDHVATKSNKPKTTDKNHVQKKSQATTVSNVPIINPRFGQSSDESPEKWINHSPLSTYQMGTIMRPILKNSKTVTKLKTTDLINNRKKLPSKYALTHHETTASGLVETKIFKGDVIPSMGGGVQIIFKDVEMLKQKSPKE